MMKTTKFEAKKRMALAAVFGVGTIIALVRSVNEADWPTDGK